MRSLTFPAATDYINFGSDASFDNVAQGTAVAWVKIPPAHTTGRRIISKGGAVSFFLRLEPAGELNLFVRRTTTHLEIASAAITPTNSWLFVAGVYNLAGVSADQKLYIGGPHSAVAETGYKTQIVGTGAKFDDSAEDVYVGSNTASQNFDGNIAGIRWYNRVLTLAELAILQHGFFTRCPPDNSGLLLNVQLDRATGTIRNLANSAANGTIVGTPVLATPAPLNYKRFALKDNGGIYVPPVGGSTTYYYRQNNYV